MNAAQLKVMEKVENLLGEHFDSYVISLTYDETRDDDTKLYGSKAVFWHGGSVHALGCTEYAKAVLLKHSFGAEDYQQ